MRQRVQPAWRAMARRRTRPPRPVARAGRALGAWLALAASGSGCYTYARVPLESVRPGETVQVRLTDAAGTRLVSDFGAYTRQLEGPLAREGADSLSISVMVGRAYNGVALEGVRQALFLGRSEVTEVRRRQLSRSRTALASAAVLAGFALLITSVVQTADENPNAGDPPPPPPPLGARAGFRISFP
jgi:hypothetical protein